MANYDKDKTFAHMSHSMLKPTSKGFNKKIRQRIQMQEVNQFLDSLKSDVTRKVYSIQLQRFLAAGHGRKRDKEADLIDYLVSLRRAGLKFATRNSAFSAIKHYYSMNDIVLNWVKIRKFLGDQDTDNDLRGYTHEEIARLIEVADTKYKAVILTLASTGMRRAAFVGIRMKDMKYIDKFGLYQIRVYPMSKEEYICFTTPEAARAINVYIKSRREKEIVRLEPNSKLLDVFPKALTTELWLLTHRAGIFEKSAETENTVRGQKRHSIPAVHGFRKFAITQMAKAKVNIEMAKIMTGHSIGVRSSYVKYDDEDLLEEYVKAIDNLTIDETQRLKKKVHDLKVDNERIDYMLEKIKEMESRIASTF